MIYEPMRPRENESAFKGGLWVSIFLHVVLITIVLWTVGPVETAKVGDPSVEMIFPDYKLAKGDIAPPPHPVETKVAPKPTQAPPPPPPPETAPVKTDQPKVLTAPNSDDTPLPEQVDRSPKKRPKTDAEQTEKRPKPADLDQMMKEMSKDHPAKKEEPKEKSDDKSLLSALDKLKEEDKKEKSTNKNKAKAKASSHSGAGGADATTQLTAGVRTAIGDEVRKCYEQDTQSHDYQNFVAHLVVTVDSSGIARKVDFAPETQAKMDADAPYRALANRAAEAVLTSSCAKLPLPNSMLGKTQTLRFVFRP